MLALADARRRLRTRLLELKAAGRKAAKSRKRRAPARKAVATKKLRAAAEEVQVVPAEEPPAAAEAPDIIMD